MLTSLLEVSEDGLAASAVPVLGWLCGGSQGKVWVLRSSWWQLDVIHDQETSFYVLACDFESSTDDSDSNQEPPEKTSWWDNDSSSDERYESENESADVQDPPVTAGCTAAQIRDNARQIIGMCCPRADWTRSCCFRAMSKLVLTQLVPGDLYAWQKNQAPVRVSAQTLEHVVPAPCTSALDNTYLPHSPWQARLLWSVRCGARSFTLWTVNAKLEKKGMK